MNRELIKSMSENSKVYEDVSVEGHNIPLLLSGANGVFICLDGGEGAPADVELFNKAKAHLGLATGNCFLFKFSDDAAGYFYSGLHGKFTYYENIYDAYKTCYDFAALYLSGKPDRHIEYLLAAVG